MAKLSNPSQVEDQIAKGDQNAFIRPGDTGKLEVKQHYAKKLAMIAKNDSVVARSFDAFNIKFDSNGMMTNPDLFDEAVNIVQQRFNQRAGASGQVPVNSVVDQTTNAVINRMANAQDRPLNQLSTPMPKLPNFPDRGTGQFRDSLNTLSQKTLDAQNVISDPQLKSKFVQIRQELIEITDSYDKGVHNVVDRLPAWMASVETDLDGAHPDQVREIKAAYEQLRTQAPAQTPVQDSAPAQRNQGQEVGQSSGSAKPTTNSLNGRYGDLAGLEQSTEDFQSYREQVIAGERARGVNMAAQDELLTQTEYLGHATNNAKARATNTYWETVAAKQQIEGANHVAEAKARGKLAPATGYANGVSAVANALLPLIRLGAAIDGNEDLVQDTRDMQRDNARFARQRNRSGNRFSNHGNRFMTESNFRMK